MHEWPTENGTKIDSNVHKATYYAPGIYEYGEPTAIRIDRIVTVAHNNGGTKSTYALLMKYSPLDLQQR